MVHERRGPTHKPNQGIGVRKRIANRYKGLTS